jgi:hypothetical protein
LLDLRNMARNQYLILGNRSKQGISGQLGVLPIQGPS